MNYYLLYDTIGSLRAVADPGGTIIKRIDYDSFGFIVNDTNPAFSVPLGFAGGFYDRDTKLVRFGARDYDPALGRWTAKDPIDFAGGDMNLYGYVGNSPVNWVDPSGLWNEDVHFYKTFVWAVFEAGIEPRIAQRIATANQGMDEAFLTKPESLRNLLPGLLYGIPAGTYLHFQSTIFAEVGLSQALKRGDIEMFGKYLHVLQDSFSHRGLEPFKHLYLSGRGDSPDQYCEGSSRENMMKGYTIWWLQEFERTRGKKYHPVIRAR